MKHDNIVLILCVSLVVVVSICIYLNSDAYNLKCVIANIDGKTYCVRERKNVKKAANMFARVADNCSKLVEYLKIKHPNNEAVDRLVRRFDPSTFCETLPTSEFTAYSENKGDKIAMCLNRKSKEDTESHLINLHTLTFVAFHELAHIMTVQENHPQIFWQNFKFLITNAKEAGIHFPRDYKKNPQEYCGMMIRDNPYFDM